MRTSTRGKPQLVVEKSDGELWGRIKIRGNLIVDSAKTLNALVKKFKALVLDFEGLEIEEFEISFDLTTFFDTYSFISIAEIAQKSGVDYGIMRQYSSG